MTDLANHLSLFLREHLPRDRGASRHTVDNYAHSFRLLVTFVASEIGKRPHALSIADLDAPMILRFLDHIENDRGNKPRTRNARLAAIKSFFRYLEWRAPDRLDLVKRVQAIPAKTYDKALIDYLSRSELQAILDTPDRRTVGGLRDRAMLHLAYAGGLRASELVQLQVQDLEQPGMTDVRILGKGRRERVLPLWAETRSVLRDWLTVRPDASNTHLFVNARHQPMSRHGFANRLRVHVAKATRRAPTLSSKTVTPHVMRHSCAMHILEATGDIRKVALWLGHSSIQTTEMYLRVDPAEKLDVLHASAPPAIRKGSFTGVSDRLISMLSDVHSRPVTRSKPPIT